LIVESQPISRNKRWVVQSIVKHEIRSADTAVSEMVAEPEEMKPAADEPKVEEPVMAEEAAVEEETVVEEASDETPAEANS
jgi:hypothetical protein